ncbi:MAG TPA: Uma2 family endonuclease [Kofleriaceae bacterium]|nr:Uma2 family endonuclease [Kofleriaceae bacterium]
MRSEPASKQAATVADLLAVPEEHRRHEIIDGVLVEKAAASARAGAATGRLARRLGPYDRRPGGCLPGGWWFATNVEVQLSDSQVFRPDIAGWRRERLDVLPATVPVTVAPDWICEILSTNQQNDLIKKQRAYHLQQVRHYWLIDPLEETFAAYRWHSDGYVETQIAERQDLVRAEPFDAIQFRVGVLFGDDDDLE